MSYRDEDGDVEGDFDDQLDHAWQIGYREGVDRVIVYIRSINAYPKLQGEIEWAIRERII